MDARRFDAVARLLASSSSRRAVVTMVLAAAASAAGGQDSEEAKGEKRRSRRTRPSRAGARGDESACRNQCHACSSIQMKSGADLRGCDFRGQILTKRDVSGSDLRGACLQGANLRGSIFDGANLGGACLQDALLTESSLRGASLRDANLCGAHLTRADLRGARASAAQLACAMVCSTTLPDGTIGDDDRGTSRACPACDGTCAKDETCCDGACAKLATSLRHCGRCGNTCPPPTPHVSVSCGEAPDAHGHLVHDCTYTCDSGWEDCDGDFETGCEVFTRGDITNCGGCGSRCGEGLKCCNCACVPEGSGACGVCPTLTSGRLIRRR